jgi:flagellar biosynthesis protein FlhG
VQIIPIASGKGGVGKSLVAANLAIALAQAGRRVVLADLDLGGSNLHLILGLRGIPYGIGTYFNTPGMEFENIIVDTDVENLRFIPGDSEIPGMANLKPQQKRNLIKSLLSLPETDILVIDLGAGTSTNTIDFFLMSSHGVIITTPTLTATLNAYFFLKNAVFRILETSLLKGSWAEAQFHKLITGGSALQKLYIPKFLDKVKEKDPASWASYQKAAAHFQPRLIFNMLEDPKDVEKAGKVRRSCREYLGFDLEHLGVIYRDEMQDIALSSRLPILLYKPQAVLSQAIYRIADKISSFERADEGPLDFQALEETHQTALLEAEVDFEAKLAYLEELLQTGALTMGDLMETVKTQQFEINQLKKENLLLKSKIVKAIQSGFKL